MGGLISSKIFIYPLKIPIDIYAGISLQLIRFQLLLHGAPFVQMDRCHHHKARTL